MISRLARHPKVEFFDQDEDNFMRNKVTIRMTFDTYSAAKEFFIKWDTQNLPDPNNMEEVLRHPIMNLLVDRSNKVVSLHYRKPLNMVNRLKVRNSYVKNART